MHENVKPDLYRRGIYRSCRNPEEAEEYATDKEGFEEVLMMYRTQKQMVISGEKEKQDKLHYAEYEARKAVEEEKNVLESIWKEIAEVDADLQQIMKDCENLVRINKEKSCSDRSIKGKKDHSGYVVIQSKEREQTYRYFDETMKENIWETTIQTPYPENMDIDLVRIQVEIEMTIGAAPLRSAGLGIDHIWEADIDSFFYQVPEQERRTDNYLLNTFFTRGVSSGYWTVTYRHSLPLKRIPENMLPTDK